MSASSFGRSLLVVLMSALVAAGCAPGQGTGKTGGSVKVLAVWGGSEQDSFLAMVKPFEDRTGIKVEYESTRDIASVLNTRLKAGNPPDVAGLPGPGQMAEFAKAGKLINLDNVLDTNQMKDQYSADWIKLGQVNGKSVGIFIKSSLKGLVWYDPKYFNAKYQPAKSWSDLISLEDKIKSDGTAPWCIGLASSGADGWPGTDWIKDIVLTQSGPDVYDQWVAGKKQWSSSEIKGAFKIWGDNFVAKPGMVYGGKQSMVSVDFADSATPMFASPPKCYLHHQANFMSGIFVEKNPALKATTDFNFFNMPAVDSKYDGAKVVAGDLFGMFKDTTQARQLMKYLTTAEAQSIWVKRGGTLSSNKKVALSDYPDDLSRLMAKTLTEAKISRFDAGDLMPAAMQAAFWKAALDFVSDPGKLDSIVAGLDKVQADAYK